MQVKKTPFSPVLSLNCYYSSTQALSGHSLTSNGIRSPVFHATTTNSILPYHTIPYHTIPYHTSIRYPASIIHI